MLRGVGQLQRMFCTEDIACPASNETLVTVKLLRGATRKVELSQADVRVGDMSVS